MIKEFNNIAIIAGNRSISYRELLDYINIFAQHTPKDAGERTLVFSENRIGWIFSFFSIWQNRGLAVPVDASSTIDDVVYIINDCHPVAIWTSREKKDVAEESIKKSGLKIKLLIVDDFENTPCLPRQQKTMIEDESIFTENNQTAALIIYTSGTTGSPKGVVLSYANLYANLHSVMYDVPIFRSDRRTLILLPLHHILPLMGTVVLPIICGGGVAICPSMAASDIMDTLSRGKIAIFIGVPRLWQTLYNGIKKKIDASPVTRFLFAICAKINNPKLSRIIFKAVHQKLGGHLDYCVSGGAALDSEIGEGLRTLGITMLEGYGMTETAPIISFTRPGDIIPGCVGLPMSTVDARIINGEICVKGPNVMLGYYNRPKETAQVIDAEGYVHTGDLGFIDDIGRIHITGRSKEIIVLSNGKNVQPNEIEYKLEKYSTIVKEVAVTQDGDILRAIIVPQEKWSHILNDLEIEEELKRYVIEPYNKTVVNYKKIMSVFVYHKELPRTKLDKLQRFKLKEILSDNRKEKESNEKLNDSEEAALTKEFLILKNYIETEKKITISPKDHLETDIAFDSLDNVGLQGFIEQTFGIEMKADTFATYKNVQEIADYIACYKTRTELDIVDWNKLITSDSSNLQLPSTSVFFVPIVAAFRCFLRLYNKLEIKGTENIPQDGQFIIAPNHESYIDGPISVAGISGTMLKNCYFYATEEHVRSRFRRYMACHNNIILMERHNLKDSILKLAEVLKKGKSIVIFPEGTRTHNGKMNDFKKTFTILSIELQIPILPVRINGAFEAMPREQKFPSTHPITVEYSPTIMPNTGESYEELALRVKKAIEARESK